MTHSCALMIICRLLARQKALTLSGPNVTSPGPLGLGKTPSTESFIVGSDHKRSIRRGPPVSIDTGRSMLSISEIVEMDLPIPPCMQTILFSIVAARGIQLNKAFILCQIQMPPDSPNLSVHSRRNPNRAFISEASWLPLIKWILRLYSIFRARRRHIV